MLALGIGDEVMAKLSWRGGKVRHLFISNRLSIDENGRWNDSWPKVDLLDSVV